MKTISFILILVLNTPILRAQKVNELKIWVNAFIPDKVFDQSGVEITKTIQNGPFAGKTCIPGPKSGSIPNPILTTFYLGDQRGFSNEINANSRMHSEVTININNSTINVGKNRVDSTHSLLTSENGELDCKGLGRVEGLSVVDQHVQNLGNGSKIFEFRFVGAVSNPCFQITQNASLSPDIDYAINVKAEVTCGELVNITATGNIDLFPAFEMYANVLGNITPVFQLMPQPGMTPLNLFGPPARLLSDLLNPPKPVAITPLTTNGTWRSNDSDERFTLAITGNQVDWTEKFPQTGITVTRKVDLKIINGQFQIERLNNDIEILRMLGFPPNIQMSIIQANPKASFMTFCINNAKILNAQFNGFLVIKDSQGNFQSLVQPGTRPPKPFTFNRN